MVSVISRSFLVFSYFSFKNIIIFRKLSLICAEVSDPVDYLWLNLEGEGRGIYFWRRLFLQLAILIFFVFFTTPVAIFTLMQQVPILAFFKFQWVE